MKKIWFDDVNRLVYRVRGDVMEIVKSNGRRRLFYYKRLHLP